MTKTNFPAALAAVLVHEGGYVNDPRDPGGATNKGVTQAVYDDWRVSRQLPKQSVRSISQYEIEAIYCKLYWNAIRGDDLPSGVDYATFDFAVNSGVNRASRYLQQVAGAVPDGQIGAITIAAVSTHPAEQIVRELCKARLNFLQQLKTFDHFGKGWSRRVAEVEAQATALV